MSSVMPLTFNAVKLCDVTINEKTWACANKVGHGNMEKPLRMQIL